MMANMVFENPIASQIGTNKSANAEPKVPGALGARPEPNPTPQNTMQRSGHDIAEKLILGLCKVLISL